MGFGILFLGYCVTYIMSLNTFGVVFRLFGAVLMLLGCRKLSEYDKKFGPAAYSLIALVLISAIECASALTGFLYDNLFISADPFSSISGVMIYVDAAAVLVFHIFLLLAVFSIAKSTEVTKIENAAIRNLFFVGLYFVLRVIDYIPLPFQESYRKNFAMPIFLLNLAWIILNAIMLFSCYAKICDEGDVEMEQKPSRFEFVNKYRAELEEKRRLADEKYAKKEQERKNKRKKK